MEVILLESVSRLGGIGDVVNVKPGYARNYLLPQDKALRATDANKAKIEAEKAVLEQKNNERKAEAEKRAATLDGVVATIVRQAAEDGKLYGSVAVRDIAVALKEEGHEVDARLINLSAPIKALGLYTVKANLHPEVAVELKVHVARNADSPLPEEMVEEEVVEETTPVEAAAEDASEDAATDTVAEEATEAAESEEDTAA